MADDSTNEEEFETFEDEETTTIILPGNDGVFHMILGTM